MSTNHETDENLYVKAIHHPDDDVRNQAFIRWLNNEVEDLYEELETADLDDMEWSRKKDRMDALALVAGIANQRRFAHYNPETRVEVVDDE